MQLSPKALSRRRVLTIMAAAAALPLAGGSATAGHTEWTGSALGADATLIVCGHDEASRRRAIDDCLAEVERLEAIFSLYRKGSEIRRLNAQGHLVAPSHDMRLLLSICRTINALTEGLFDPTVQPLWELYADWFAANPGGAGPPAEMIGKVLERVGFEHVKIAPDLVRLPADGGFTLNGIAQGYITDRIADLLRQRGWTNVLVNMGEQRALGAKPDGQPWTVVLREPGVSVPLTNKALATSAGEALMFGANRRASHLIDPRTGRSPRQFRSLTVCHSSAAVADALSTGLYAAAPATARNIATRVPGLRVWASHAGGKVQSFGS